MFSEVVRGLGSIAHNAHFFERIEVVSKDGADTSIFDVTVGSPIMQRNPTVVAM
jgi:hypothetical protein